MSMSSPYGAALLALAAGMVSHLFYFHVGEHHMLAVTYIQLFILACSIGTLCLTNFAEATTADAIITVFALAGSWLAGVFGSLVSYRLFFHPLNGFPGPWQARLGDLWFTSKLGKLNGYYILHDLHKKYGRFVRVGSNTLSVTDPQIMQPAYGSHSKVGKSDWYNATMPHQSMHMTRDKSLHDRRRRVWAPAFSDKALKEYEITVREFNDKLVNRIGDFEGQSINMTTWFNLYSFDIMGRLAFGKDYGMIDAGKRHWALDLLSEGMEPSGFRFPTWFFRILLSIPGAANGYHKFLKFCIDETKWRVQNGKSVDKDIIGWLLKAYVNEKHPEDDPLLQADTELIIVAGSDTTSAALTYLFYHLSKEPEQQKKLREELKPLTTGEWSDKDIQHAEHLNGVINETLRLHPPVPSGLKRHTPKEGIQVGGTLIPGNSDFFVPMYAMGRDDSVYSEASSFVPERWYSRPDMIKHQDAFAPFSMGQFNCIGRNLARMELRTLSAQLLLKYDVSLAPGEDGTRLMTRTKDHFTMSLGQLDLVYTPASS